VAIDKPNLLSMLVIRKLSLLADRCTSTPEIINCLYWYYPR